MPSTPIPAAQRLADLAARQAGIRPDAPAIRFEGQTLSYAQLHQRSLETAGWLAQAGVRQGDRVAWLGLNHADQIALLLALARLGALLVPLNFRLAAPEWDAVLADCTPCLLVHDAAWQEAAQSLAQRHGLPAHAVTQIGAGPAGLAGVPAQAEPAAHHAADLPVLLVYTSGTTGTPKGAVHTQGNLLANMAAAAQVQGLGASDTVLTVLPLFHVGGLCIQTLPALGAGACVVLHARFEPGATLAAIADHRPSLTVLVPAVMKAMIEHPAWTATALDSLRAVWAGSSTLPPPLVEAFHARGVPVCNVYGATETGPFSVALGPEHAVSHAGACGWPAPGVQVRLGAADAAGDGVGELWLRGPAIVQRYWPDHPALDAQGWFHSGDLGQQAADGSWRVVGRAKDMIISGGENIYPAEIENVLLTHPDVAECAVLGVADARWGEAVVAAVVPRPGHQAEAGALHDFLQTRVARYKLPRRYVSLPALPRTALGKVQKSLLLKALP
ncbi:MAG: AMP-binding protein [Ramlibacter sp.]|nr:AMP-binding protein [Ramlibacter sp.]